MIDFEEELKKFKPSLEVEEADEVRKNYNIDTKRNIKFIRDKQTLEETIDLIDEHIDNLSCGHSTIYQCYVDSDDCCICNKQEIGELF